MKNAYYNGTISDMTEIRIPLTDRSVYFGDGVYDAMIGRQGRIYLIDEHVERLFRSAKAIGLRVKESIDELKELIYSIVEKSGLHSYFVYVQLSRSSAERTHSCDNSSFANLLITVKAHELPTPDHTLSLTVTQDLRYYMCNVKTINLLPAVLASTDAESKGFDEAVFARRSVITECAHSNIAIVKDGALLTHHDSDLILPGITKMRLIAIAKREGIPVFERPFSIRELHSADSVIVTSTSKLALEARCVDETFYNTGKNIIAKSLITALFEEYWKSMED